MLVKMSLEQVKIEIRINRM